jgi:hypothetical protein
MRTHVFKVSLISAMRSMDEVKLLYDQIEATFRGCAVL